MGFRQRCGAAAVWLAAIGLCATLWPGFVAGAAETLPHPLLFPLIGKDAPLSDTSFLDKPYRDDLSGLIERRVIRVLVSYNRSNFFLKDGGPQGFEYELTQAYRKFLKKKLAKSAWPVAFVYIPLAEDQLLPALRGGWAGHGGHVGLRGWGALCGGRLPV